MRRAIIASCCCVLGASLSFAEPVGAPGARPAVPKAAGAAAPQKKEARKTIGVISELGDVYTVQTVGFMVFGNERKELSIASWEVDRFAAFTVGALVKQHYAVEGLTLTPDAKAALRDAPSGLWGDRGAYVCRVLRSLTPGKRFDYYLWVNSTSTEVAHNNTQHVRGLGVLRWGGEHRVHAIFGIEALDGQTCERKRFDYAAQSEDGGELLLQGVGWPNAKVGEADFESAAKGTINKKLKDATVELLERLLVKSVKRIFAPS